MLLDDLRPRRFSFDFPRHAAPRLRADDRHATAARIKLRRLGRYNLQHAVVEARADLGAVDVGGQLQRAPLAALRALGAVVDDARAPAEKRDTVAEGRGGCGRNEK